MSTIDSRAAQQIQPKLLPGESILWAAMPNPKIIFHSDDWIMIPFTAAWLAFACFWEAEVLGLTGRSGAPQTSNLFFQLWGIPFVVVGNYMFWGRFFVDAWLKHRTYYAITNRRAIVVQDGWKSKTNTLFLREITSISAEGTETGTLWLGPKYPVIAGRGQPTRSISRYNIGGVPVLADIDHVIEVHQLLLQLGSPN